jgi:GT2 family glycosyltransferase/peptidoglycan/xylan/chitin deacetylase (PgdA/CDA1 family)
MPQAIPVFLYHRVGANPDLFTVDPQTYASHLALIAASGRTPVTVTELASALRGERELPQAPVCLTFDDGYVDTRATIEAAAELGVKSTLYVTVGAIDTPGAVTRTDLQTLAANTEYVELGAHTVTHPRLDELRAAAAEQQITESRDALADLIGSAVRSFAYPHGAYSARVRQIVIDAGFDSAAAVKNALSHEGDDPWAIARFTVTRETPRSQIEALLRGEGAPLAWANDRLRTRGYRLVRTARRRLHDAGAPAPAADELEAPPIAVLFEGIPTDVHAPVAVAQLDLGSEEPRQRLRERQDGKPYNAVAVLVRDHGVPVAWTVVPTPASGVVSTAELPPEFRVARVTPPAIPVAAASSMSVVVTTCADSSTTANCVRALLASDAPPAEVIVVDNRPNGSPVRANLDELFCAAPVPVRYVPESRPGLAVARNAGLAVARSEFVAFTDDDVTVDPYWLTALRTSFALHPEFSCVTGLILPLELETEAQLDFERFASLSKGLISRRYSLSKPPPDMPLFPYAAGHFGSGANAAFRRSAMVAIGGFDPLLGTGTRTHGGEDLDIFIRLLASGQDVAYDPAAVVWHRHPTNDDGMSQRTLSYGIGFGAVTGKLLMSSDHRGRILRLAPQALSYWFRGSSRKNVGRGTGADARRTLGRETLGVAIGPVMYFASWLLSRPQRSRSSGVADRKTVPASTTPAPFTPLWSGQLELQAPSLPTLLAQGGQTFAAARLLVLAAGTPLGFIQIDSPAGAPDLAAAVELARSTFGERVEQAFTDQAWSQASGPFVSVVLCTHDRAAGARRTLESLRALAYENFEVIVVDNAPSDDSTKVAVKELEATDSRIRYVCEPLKGLSRARNRGLAEATGEVIAFTDDDVIVDPLWLRGLLRGFERRNDVACVTGLVATCSLAHPAEQYFDRRVWWASNCDHKLYTSERGPGDSILHPYAAGAFGTGANFACRVAILRTLGGFDQCLGAGSPTQGGEDLDIFVRLLRAGHALSYEPSALVWHEHRVDDESLRKQMYGYGLGLTAYLTKYAASRRSRAAVARRTLSGVGHAVMLIRRSRGAGAESSLHSGLVSAEIRGMLNGPLAYWRARRCQDPEHLKAVAP